MDRELTRLGSELDALRTALEDKLATRSERLYAAMDELEAGLGQLRDRLEALPEPPGAGAPPAVATAAQGLSPAAADQPAPEPAEAAPPAPPAEPDDAGVEAAADPEAPAPPSPPPAAAEGPGWVVNLLAFQRQDKAEQEAARLRSEGVPARVQTVTSRGSTWHRLVVRFEDYGAAKGFAEGIRSRRGMEGAWISRSPTPGQ
jgi:cell division septation protein DedD